MSERVREDAEFLVEVLNERDALRAENERLRVGVMQFSVDEFVSAREASRRLGKLIDRLSSGELAKAVVVDRNRPRAVIFAFPPDEATLTVWPEGREGMVVVFDSLTREYLGCMGRERWQEMLRLDGEQG